MSKAEKTSVLKLYLNANHWRLTTFVYTLPSFSLWGLSAKRKCFLCMVRRKQNMTHGVPNSYLEATCCLCALAGLMCTWRLGGGEEEGEKGSEQMGQWEGWRWRLWLSVTYFWPESRILKSKTFFYSGYSETLNIRKDWDYRHRATPKKVNHVRGRRVESQNYIR